MSHSVPQEIEQGWEIAAGDSGLKGCPGTEREEALRKGMCFPRTLSTVPGANLAMQLRVLQQSGLQCIATNLICSPGSIWILASLNLAVGSIEISHRVSGEAKTPRNGFYKQGGLLGGVTEFQLCPFLAA